MARPVETYIVRVYSSLYEESLWLPIESDIRLTARRKALSQQYGITKKISEWWVGDLMQPYKEIYEPMYDDKTKKYRLFEYASMRIPKLDISLCRYPMNYKVCLLENLGNSVTAGQRYSFDDIRLRRGIEFACYNWECEIREFSEKAFDYYLENQGIEPELAMQSLLFSNTLLTILGLKGKDWGFVLMSDC